MGRKIKLIWDFRGPSAADIARHHERHLKEFSFVEELSEQLTGCQDYSTSHSMAYLVVSQEELNAVKNSLQPHRGEYVSDEL